MAVAPLALLIDGCSQIARLPELAPDHYAPLAVTESWSPPADARSYSPAAISDAQPSPAPSPHDRRDAPYTLAELIDLGLRLNPATRVDWERARGDAANWGRVRADYYPKVSTETDIEYSRTEFQIAGGNARIKTAQVTPMVELTYTLIDFGRRRAASDIAREQLAAANFTFNRQIQTVVFNAQRFFYSLAAAKAAVEAAHQNLTLAQTDDDAVSERVNHGLATEPELLLSRQRVAQAEYDVANAELLTEEAQANLAVAIGITANAAIDVEGLEHQQVPDKLDGEVDTLIKDALGARPDLAADVATVRADQASIRAARATFMPEVDVLGNYGEQNWGYTFNAAPQIQGNLPEYTALLALKWDIFVGFSRINAVREAEAQRRASAADLQSQELAAIAEVWRAYYEFQSSRKRYEYARALLSASNESYAALIDTYRQGLSTIVELLSAERDLANARYTMIQSTADLLTASAATAYAVGAVTK
jgi:outer membrane protein TolC